MLLPQMEKVPGIQCLRRFTLDALTLGRTDLRFDLSYDRCGDLVLHFEHFIKLAVIALYPEMPPPFCFDELHIYTYPLINFADATLHHIIGAQVRSNAAHVRAVPLEREC